MGWLKHVVARVGVRFWALTASVVLASVGAGAQAQQAAPPTQQRWSRPPPSTSDTTGSTHATGQQLSAASAHPPPAGRLPWRDAMEREPLSAEAVAKENRSWYGWQTLIADSLSIGLIALSLGSDGSEIALVGVGVLTFASPLVHFVHENSQGGLISLGTRALSVGLFVLGGVLVADNIFDDSSSGSNTESFIGSALLILSLAGEIAAIAVDASLLAFEPKNPRARQSAAGVAPWLDPKRGSYGLRFGLAL